MKGRFSRLCLVNIGKSIGCIGVQLGKKDDL